MTLFDRIMFGICGLMALMFAALWIVGVESRAMSAGQFALHYFTLSWLFWRLGWRQQ